MGQRNITLLAVHFHNDGDMQIGPKSIGAGGRAKKGSNDRGKRRRDALPIPLAVGAIGLIAFAVLVRRALASR